MPFVLDTSVTLAWCFEDEASAYADHVQDLLDNDTALAPAIWPLEVANALCTGQRRGRLQPTDVSRFVNLLRCFPVIVEGADLDRALGAVLDLARAQGLASYDASYLDLAMREGIPLATRDARLMAAAGRVGVALVQ